MVTRGEALGHEMWLDSEFVKQTAEAVAASKLGVKARFTHPGLSSDGLGKFLGRIKGGYVDGDVARADLHLTESSHNTPDGDLAEYVMNLAEEDPQAFATSVVFEHDSSAEEALVEDCGGRFEYDETGYRVMVGFESPDPMNENNYIHARLSKLWADDVVDEPAANPGGLFHRGDEVAAEADGLLSYALGLSAEKPKLSQLEIDPDRVSGFVQRFMAQHGLSVVSQKENQLMAENPKTGAPAPDNKPDEISLERERFAALKAKYGNDAGFVLEMFEANKTMAEAEVEWMKRELAKRDQQIAALTEQVEASKKAPKVDEKPAGASPVGFAAPEDSGPADYLGKVAAYRAAHKCSISDAQMAVSQSNPAIYREYKKSIGAFVND